MGVQMFFALSGRLMADILFVERFPLGKFYKRRFSRVYPGLLVFVVLTYFLVRSTSLSFKPLGGLLGLTFLLNYAMIVQHGVAAIENLWSLCIEEHSYLILGVFAFLIRQRNGNPKLILFAVAVLSLADGLLSALVLHQQDRDIFWRTDAQLAPIFLAGGFYLHFRGRQVASWIPPAVMAAAIAMGFANPLLGYSIGTGLFSLAIAKLDDAPRTMLKLLSVPFLVYLGLWSYSIYLWQQPFYRFAFEGKLNPFVAIGLGISAGLVSFYLVEQPARRWLNANWRKRPKTAPALQDVSLGEGTTEGST